MNVYETQIIAFFVALLWKIVVIMLFLWKMSKAQALFIENKVGKSLRKSVKDTFGT